jgi:tol-pal system protein YbgF
LNVRKLRFAVLTAAFMAAVLSSSVHAARLSLAERMTALEQQLAARGNDNQLTADLLQRIEQLKQETQELRNQAEQQTFEIDQLKRQLRALEATAQQGFQPAPPVPPGFVDPLTADQGLTPAPGPAGDGMFEPEVRPPVDGQTQTNPIAVPQPPSRAPMVSDPAAEKAAYDAAFNELKSGRYDAAGRGFDQFLKQFPNSTYAGNAQYWLAESYFVTQNYPVALQAFRTMTQRYGDSPKLGDAMLKIGYTLYELKQFPQARVALQAVIERFPGSTVAKLAESRLRAFPAAAR